MLAGAEGTSFLESPASEFAAPLVDEDDGAEDASLEGVRVGATGSCASSARAAWARCYLAERADGAVRAAVALKLLRARR